MKIDQFYKSQTVINEKKFKLDEINNDNKFKWY